MNSSQPETIPNLELYNDLKKYYTDNSEESKNKIKENFDIYNSDLQALIDFINEKSTIELDYKKDLLIILSYFNTLDEPNKTIETFLKIFEDHKNLVESLKIKLTNTGSLEDFISYRYLLLSKTLYESNNIEVLSIGINEILNINKIIAYLEYHILLEKEIENEENKSEYNEMKIFNLIKKFNENTQTIKGLLSEYNNELYKTNMHVIFKIIIENGLSFKISNFYNSTRRNNPVYIANDDLIITNLLNKLEEIKKSISELSILDFKRIRYIKMKAKKIIDLAFVNLYKLFVKDGDYTTKLKRYIQSVLNNNLNVIKPSTTSTYTYKSHYLDIEKKIEVAFGGENKKKARKLKKYNP
jgi:hypothetical protein